MTTTKDIQKIIEISTVRDFKYNLIQESDTRWKLEGSLPSIAIEYLHREKYNCYLRNNEFFISTLMKGENNV